MYFITKRIKVIMMGDRAANILLILSGTILLIWIILSLIGVTIGLNLAGDPTVRAIMHYLFRHVVFYLVLSISWFIIALIGKKKGERLGLGIASLVVTGFTLLYTIWFTIFGIIPLLSSLSPASSLVLMVALLVILIMAVLGTIGGILKLLAGISGGA